MDQTEQTPADAPHTPEEEKWVRYAAVLPEKRRDDYLREFRRIDAAKGAGPSWNWSLYSGGPLSEYVSNATLDATQHYFVSILSEVDLSELIGARVLVGYGTDDQDMLANQRYREIYIAQPAPTQ